MLALATAIGQERASSGRLLSVLASVAGVVVIALGNLGDRSPEGATHCSATSSRSSPLISWGAYLTVGKPLVARYGSLPTLAGTFLVGARARRARSPAATAGGWAAAGRVSPGAWRATGYLVLRAVGRRTALSEPGGIRRLDASHVATFGNISTLLTMLWGHSPLRRATPRRPWRLGGGLIMLGLLGSEPAGRPVGIARRSRLGTADPPPYPPPQGGGFRSPLPPCGERV